MVSFISMMLLFNSMTPTLIEFMIIQNVWNVKKARLAMEVIELSLSGQPITKIGIDRAFRKS